MPGGDRVFTFVVRVVESSSGDVRAVVERVKTGRKQQARTIDSIGPTIAAMTLEESSGLDATGDPTGMIDPQGGAR
jgi:hypothetical protein